MVIGESMAIGSAYLVGQYAKNKETVDGAVSNTLEAIGDAPNIAKDVISGNNPVDGFTARQAMNAFYRGYGADMKDDGNINGSDLVKKSEFLRDYNQVSSFQGKPSAVNEMRGKFINKYNLDNPDALNKRNQEYDGFRGTINQRQSFKKDSDKIMKLWTDAARS